jgi:hypothetical protein
MAKQKLTEKEREELKSFKSVPSVGDNSNPDGTRSVIISVFSVHSVRDKSNPDGTRSVCLKKISS